MRIFITIIILFICAHLFGQDNVSLVVQSGHSGPVTDVVFSADDRFIITSGEDKRIVIWDRITRKQFGVLQGHTKSVNDLCIVPDDPEHVYSVSDDGYFIKWHILLGKKVKSLQPGSSLGAIDYAPARKTFAIGGVGLSIIPLAMDSIIAMNLLKNMGSDFYNEATIEDVAFDDSGSRVVITDGKGRVTTVPLSGEGKGEIVTTKSTSAVMYSKDSKYIYTIYYTGNITRHKPGTYGIKRSLVWLGFQRLNTMVRLKDGRIAIGNEKGNIVFVSSKSLWLKGRIKAHKEEVVALGLNRDSSLLVSTSGTGDIKVWDLKDKTLKESYRSTVHRINDIALSDDGRYIAAGYDNGTVRVFDLQSFKTMELDAAKRVARVNDRKKAQCSKLEWNGAELTVFMLKTKRSSELLWMYDYIKDVKLTWNPFTNVISKPEAMEVSVIGTSYYNNIKDYMSRGTPTLLDPDNLTITGKDVGVNPQHSDRISSMTYNKTADMVASASWDGLVKFWDAGSGKLKLTLGLFEEGRFVMIDPENYYFSSREGLDNIGFKYRQEVFSFEQFDLKYNRPDRVLEQLTYLHSSSMISSYKRAYEKRLERMGINAFDLELSNDVPTVETHISRSDGQQIELEIVAEAESHDLSKLHIYVNGVPEFGKQGKPISGRQFKDGQILSLSPGSNVIHIYVTASNGLASLKDEFVVTGSQIKETRTLYLVTIGVSEFEQSDFNLNYAAQDAQDISSYFRKNNPFDSLAVISLLNEDVTKEGLESVQKKLKDIKTNDGLIVFAAGHGVLSEALDFYFASYDMDFEDPATRGISYTSLEDLLDACASRYKCFLLDACHSGEFDKEEVELAEHTEVEEGEIKFRHVGTNISQKGKSSFELFRALFADMRPNSGTTVISSAGGAEYALEGGDWKNGVFTYAFLEGLSSGSADLDNDGDIYLSEIHKYVADKVSSLTGGKQTPTSRVENAYNDFKIR